MMCKLTLVLLVVSSIGCQVHCKNLALETNDVTDQFISSSINTIFDLFLKHYTKKLVEEGKTEIQIGNFDRRFTARVLSLDIEGAFDVDDGWCGNISTLHRTGDADLSWEGKDGILSAHLGLSDLTFDYNSYDISLLGVHQKGKIHVKIGENSVWLKLSLQLQPKCVVSLSDVKVEKLDKIEVDITNLGIFENLTDEITSWVVYEVTKEFKGAVERDINPVLAKIVEKANICRYLPI